MTTPINNNHPGDLVGNEDQAENYATVQDANVAEYVAQHAAMTIIPTQVVKPWQSTIRTAVQVILGLAVVLPVVLLVAGIPPVSIIPAVVAVTAAFARVMANPTVEDFLQSYVPWLSAGGSK